MNVFSIVLAQMVIASECIRNGKSVCFGAIVVQKYIKPVNMQYDSVKILLWFLFVLKNTKQ